MGQAIAFKTIYLPTNQGHGNARRASLCACSHDLVALMDADDLSVSNRFQLQLERFAEDDTLDIVGGQIHEFVGSRDNVIATRIVPEEDGEIKAFLKKRCPMNQVSVMFRKDSVEKVGGYIDWYCEEDYYLWVRMAQAGCRFANVPENLVDVRVGDEMSARRGGMRYFLSEERLQRYMLKNKLISLPQYAYNTAIRFGGEVVVPTKLRTKLFKLFRSAPDSLETLRATDGEKPESVCRESYPSFSVSMCVYGGDNPVWFDEALQSVVNQTVRPREIVLAVDGPVPEEIQAVIKKYEAICGADMAEDHSNQTEKKMKQYRVGYTTGVFDMFHIGHLNIIKRAKQQCDYLIVGVTTDALCKSRKKKLPIICEAERMEILEAIRYVDRVVPQEDMDKLSAVKKYGADAVFVGSDWKGTPAWCQYEKEFAQIGCTVVYLDHTDGISSTVLRDKLNAQEA